MEINIEVNKQESQTAEKEVRKPSIDKSGRSYATGKRKEAIARVWVKPGKGTFTVNGKKLGEYFKRLTLQTLAESPFAVTSTVKKFDVMATVKGSGLSAQADAIKHGVSKALVEYNPEAYQKELRQAGFLTRDARVVERKKYGRKKARKSFQFSKR